ncbi:peptidoglycan D,D-transpeptidase FtsI family protein [Jatrophihabitans sp. YIM 134969]
MNLNSRRVGGALVVLLVALLVNLTIVQFFQGPSLASNDANRRQLLAEYSRQRGPIVVDGNPVAQSVATTDALKFQREYPGGAQYAPITGYYSLFYGTSGIESAENSVLSGNDDRLFGTRLNDILTGRDPKGGRVDLTIDPQAQLAAFHGLADQGLRGAVVAMDPTTGAILAAVSTPSYDPSQLSSHDPDAIEAYYDKLAADPAQPLLNRAFNQIYPPGSTFKVVVSAAALAAGATPDTKIDSPTTYQLPDSTSTLSNFEGESCGNSTITLQQALTISCNTAFAIEAVKLGKDKVAEKASLFGFDTGRQEVPLPVNGSTIGPVVDGAALAQTAIGQRDVRMTPLQGAMIAAAVANRGVLMQPYLVDRELAPDLSVISKTDPKERATVMTPDQADDLGRMMVSVVANGTGTRAAIDGTTVAGKTGTADTGFTSDDGGKPDAWFIGYTASGPTKIAVAVIVEGAGSSTDETTGGDRSAPIAKSVIEAYLKSAGRS